MIRVFYSRLKAKCNHWQQPFLKSRKLARENSIQIQKRQNLDSDCKNGKQNYLEKSKKAWVKASEATSRAACFAYFSGFPSWLAWFSLQIFCLNYKIHFSLANENNNSLSPVANADNSASLEKKWFKFHGFCPFTNNKQTCKWSCQRFPPSGQDRKKPPALETNQTGGFGGFRPLASLEKNK